MLSDPELQRAKDVFVHGTFCVLTTIVILAVSPILGIALLSLYVCRWCIELIVQVTSEESPKPEIFTGCDSLFLTDKYLARPSCAISTALVLEGKLDFEEYCRKYEELLNTQRSDGSCKYDRFLQYPEVQGGFCFWHWDTQFDIRHHIKVIDDKLIRDDNMSDYISQFARLPFQPKKPLWEVHLVPNYNGEEEKFLMILRNHHSVADGLSLVKFLLSSDSNNPVTTVPQSSRIKKNWSTKLWIALKFIFEAPYVYIQQTLAMQDVNCLLRDVDTKTDRVPSGQWVFTKTAPVSLSKLREAKQVLRIPLTSILICALSKGFENYIAKNIGEDQVPNAIHILCPFPVSGHPDDRMSNHWTVLCMKLQLKYKSLYDRLSAMKTEFERATKSSFVTVSYFMCQIAGTCPLALVEPLTKLKSATIFMSNMPGSSTPSKLLGYNVIENMFWLPLCREANAISVGFISYKDELRMTLAADKAYIPDKQRLDHFGTLIENELKSIMSESEE